ncbi:hypothetical protein GCM10027027_21250 [Neomicrococcus lactis]
MTTVCDRDAVRFPDLVKRGWNVTELNTVWVADFTYVRVPSGFVYVAFITDVTSRRILGWNVDSSRRTPLVTTALNHALMVRRTGGQRFSVKRLIHHSDADTQYTSAELKDVLSQAGMRGSIGTVGDTLDNALMESKIGLYKRRTHSREETESMGLCTRSRNKHRTVGALVQHHARALEHRVPNAHRIREQLQPTNHA